MPPEVISRVLNSAKPFLKFLLYTQIHVLICGRANELSWIECWWSGLPIRLLFSPCMWKRTYLFIAKTAYTHQGEVIVRVNWFIERIKHTGYIDVNFPFLLYFIHRSRFTFLTFWTRILTFRKTQHIPRPRLHKIKSKILPSSAPQYTNIPYKLDPYPTSAALQLVYISVTLGGNHTKAEILGHTLVEPAYCAGASRLGRNSLVLFQLISKVESAPHLAANIVVGWSEHVYTHCLGAESRCPVLTTMR